MGIIFPCRSESDFSEKLNSVRNEHADATHHCNAYRIDPNNTTEFSSDDGEPSGTAGMPILNSLRSKTLINIGLIVVRYYGGTKLGKSGLIEAYRLCSDETINVSQKKKVVPAQNYRIVYKYSHQSIIDKLKHDFTLFEIKTEYFENVTLTFACPAVDIHSFEKAIKKYQHLFISMEKLQPSYRIIS